MIARNLCLGDIQIEKAVAIRNKAMDTGMEKPGNKKSPTTVTLNSKITVGIVNLLVFSEA